jgi:hypothetical protein
MNMSVHATAETFSGAGKMNWIFFTAAVLFIKFLFFFLDPIPKFFFGDSECYVCTAVKDWIPPDRSFTYGYVIRLAAVFAGSFMPLLAIQIVASTLSAVILAVALNRFFSVTPIIAYLFGILCAVEPIQLLYERYVMTETLSLFLFALYIASLFRYLQCASLRVLCLVQLIGTLLISLRVSYLPIVLLNAGLLPLLAAMEHTPPRTVPQLPLAFSVSHAKGKLPCWSVRGCHLLISVALTFLLHTAYKQLFAALSEHPPGYHACGGLFILSIWAPVVEPIDFPYPELRDQVFGDLRYPLKDRTTRGDQMFSEGGLISRMEAAIAYAPECNRAALTTAMNALRREPLGIAKLSAETIQDYFHPGLIRATIMNDLGMNQVPEYQNFYRAYEKYFAIPGGGIQQPFTLTKRYYQNALPWYWFLLLSPLLAAVALLYSRGSNTRHMLELFVLIGCSAATASILTVAPVVRYLQPVAWLALCLLGIICNKIFLRSGLHKRLPSGGTPTRCNVEITRRPGESVGSLDITAQLQARQQRFR